MSRLTKLLAQPKEVEIEGEKFMIKPLTVKNLDLIMDMQSESKRAEAMRKIVSLTLKEAIPEATDEEINGIALEHLNKLMEAISEVNGLNESKTKN